MSEREPLDRLLRQVLVPRLGHAPTRWPQPLYDLIREQARLIRTTELDALRELGTSPDSPAFGQLVDAATVPHTSFFRHPEQFEHLQKVLRKLEARRNTSVKIWCAGCATGEEAYSVALCAESVSVPVQIWATDVSPAAIRFARAGRYARKRGGRLIPGNGSSEEWIAPTVIKQAIQFEVRSLVDPDPAGRRGPFDLIFCRNVLIYFAREDVPGILELLASQLRHGGSLVISPADTVLPMPDCLARGAAVGFLAVRGREPPVSMPRVSVSTNLVAAPPPLLPIEDAARLIGAGELDRAEHMLTDLLNSTPDNLAGWFLLGEILLQRGERSQARAAFERVARGSAHAMEGFDAETLAWAAARRVKAITEDR